MSNSGTAFSPGVLRRAVLLGIVVFVAFVVAGGAVWALGSALGLGNVPAFLVAVCVGPLLVVAVVLGWLFSLPLERRQKLLGVTSSVSSNRHEETGEESS